MKLPCQIIRSDRKTISIQIKPDGQVLVRCPRKMPLKDIESFTQSKAGWIEKQLAKVKQQDTIPLEPDAVELLRAQTRKLVEARVKHFAPVIGVTYGRIAVRIQRTRWGSCSSKGNLNFNCLLALVPAEVLDYIVVHELCHLKELNHSARFWEEVARVLPDFKSCEKWLRENGAKLIAKIP